MNFWRKTSDGSVGERSENGRVYGWVIIIFSKTLEKGGTKKKFKVLAMVKKKEKESSRRRDVMGKRKTEQRVHKNHIHLVLTRGKKKKQGGGRRAGTLKEDVGKVTAARVGKSGVTADS